MHSSSAAAVGLLVVLSSALFSTAGCGGAVADEEDDAIANALAAPNGGFNESNEAAAFGDPDTDDVPDLDETESVSSALQAPASEAEAANAANAATTTKGARSFYVLLVWGRLPFLHGDDAPIWHDWTGSISVDRGVINHVHTVKFDRRDWIQRPDAHTIGMISHTRPHVDGLFFHITLPSDAAELVHFSTVSLKRDVDLAALEGDVGGVVPVDENNGLLWAGFEDRPGCRRGLMFGKWKNHNAKRGRFIGRTLEGEGNANGYVRGVFGRPAGHTESVFFGKQISANGEARALLGGTAADGRAEGWWKRIHGAADDAGELGHVEVRASKSGDGKGNKHGVWFGRYSDHCE